MKEPVLEMSFAAGIDQSQRSELLDPRAAFVMLENVRAPTKGAVTKRYGFSAHAAGLSRLGASARSAGKRMFAHERQVCVIDGDTLDYSCENTEQNVSAGRVPECGLSMMKLPAPPGQSGLVMTDAIVSNGYLVLAYTSGTGIWVAVVDAVNGAVMRQPEFLVGGSSAESYALLGAYDQYVMTVSVESGSGATRLRYIDLSSIASGWQLAYGNLGGDRDTNSISLGVVSLTDRIAAAYINNSGGASQITVKTFTIAALLQTQTVNTTGVKPNALALEGSIADTLWLAWNESTDVKVMGLDADLITGTALATAASVITAVGSIGFADIAVLSSSTAGAGRLFVNDGADLLQMRNFTTALGAVATSGSQVTAYNVQRSSAPFRVGSRYYAACRGYDSSEDVVIVCDLTDTNAWVRPLANIAPRLATSLPMCRVPERSTRQFWLPVAVQTAGNVTGAFIAKLDFDASYRWRPVAHNGVTFLSGGLLSYFDGVRVAESGFVIRPPAVTLGTSGVATFTATGDGIRVVATYEQVDGAGNWHISDVSPPTASGAFANKEKLTITVRDLGISARIGSTTDPRVRISLWATQDGGESPYFYLTSLTNTLTAATHTYDMTDHVSTSGALLMGTGELPGTGAQQARRAPSGMDHLCSYNGFLVGALGETLYWSGQDVGGEGTWWSPIFQQPCSGGGDITALDAQDGTVFAFKRDRIFALAGQPPADNGADGGLGAPTRLAVDIGANSPFTCVTSLGIFFVSDRGIELLGRSRQVEFIGEGIQDTFAEYPYVTSMTYDPNSSCVYIEAASAYTAGVATTSGRTFIFDTRSRVWRSVDRRAVSATADVPAQDGGLIPVAGESRYGWLRSNGTVYYEERSSKIDPGSARVRMYAKTSCIHIAGIQGEQCIEGMLALGEAIEDHDLEVGVANDYSDTFVSETRGSDEIAAMSLYNPHFDIQQQTGQAVQVEIEDAAPTGTANSSPTGDGAKWVALTFIGVPKQGVKRTSAVLRGGT